MTSQRQQEEIDRNYDAFMAVLDSLLPEHRDQLALMKDGRIVGYFDTPRSALEAATGLFPDGVFSQYRRSPTSPFSWAIGRMRNIEWRRERRRILLPVQILLPFPVTDLTGIEATALLDTGSSISGVSAALAEKLRLKRLGKRPLPSAQGREM
ncbi:MAG: hypothetical protein ACJ8ER_08220 [Allosphingosinicella sp.]